MLLATGTLPCATVHLFASDALVRSRGAYTYEILAAQKVPQNPLLREGDVPWEVAWWNHVEIHGAE